MLIKTILAKVVGSAADSHLHVAFVVCSHNCLNFQQTSSDKGARRGMYHIGIVGAAIHATCLRIAIIAVIVHTLWFEVVTIIEIATSWPTYISMPMGLLK